MIGYIYAIWNTNEEDIFYVGSSVCPQKRIKAHIFDNKYFDDNTNKHIPIDDTKFNLLIIDEISFIKRGELLDLEAYWIRKLKQLGYNLKNIMVYEKRGTHHNRTSDAIKMY